MKKLRLDLENLKVDSFATTSGTTPAKGTVFGQDTDVGLTCGAGCNTEDLSCGGACSTQCTYVGQGSECEYATCGCASWANCASQDTFDCGTCNTTTPGYWDSCTDWGCTYCNNVC